MLLKCVFMRGSYSACGNQFSAGSESQDVAAWPTRHLMQEPGTEIDSTVRRQTHALPRNPEMGPVASDNITGRSKGPFGGA